MTSTCRILLSMALILTLPVAGRAGGGSVIRSAAEISRAVYAHQGSTNRFEIRATVLFSTAAQDPKSNIRQNLNVKDESGCTSIYVTRWVDVPRPTAGDEITVSGSVCKMDGGVKQASAESITIHSHGSPPKPIVVSASEINKGCVLDNYIELSGILTDVFRDEIDPKIIYLVLFDGINSAYAHIAFTPKDLETLSELRFSRLTLTGVCRSHRNAGGRKKVGLEIYIPDSEHIQTSGSLAREERFVAPPLHDPINQANAVISGDMGLRKVTGTVLTVRQKNRALLQTESGEVSEVEISDTDLPVAGDSIEAIGIPETDLYQLGLSKSIWRKIPDITITNPPVESVTAPFMLTDMNGNLEVKTGYSGKLIRMVGKIRALPSVRNGELRLNLSCDGFDIPVDFSPVPDALGRLEEGSTIEVSGLCVIDCEKWRPQAPFPHARGFSIVLRNASDVRIISDPPWWTPRKFLAVIGILLLLIVVICLRNHIQKRMAKIRFNERTRLAVELHDALSQTLTGVALEISAAERLSEQHAGSSRQHLNLASQALKSCRAELKNCLWDLRNNALEESDVNEAIRRTLEPQIGTTSLTVRFNVQRKRLTDNIMHAILRIIRELAVNAVRHGNATAIRIAGAVDKGVLMFSVKDNGSGFDTEIRPGMREGHFGLQGIEERVNDFEGRFQLDSSPGNGTKATVTLNLDTGANQK